MAGVQLLSFCIPFFLAFSLEVCVSTASKVNPSLPSQPMSVDLSLLKQTKH